MSKKPTKQPVYDVTLKKPIKKQGNPMEAKEQVVDDMRSGIIGVEDLDAKKVGEEQ